MNVSAPQSVPWRPPVPSQTVDVLIIGGGIVGAGIARDAAMRGLRTMLVEQGDFASGTSSRSSRLLHGGLRYLAQGRIGLVRESSLEKMRLAHIAPHLCQPMPFVFPVWRGAGWSLTLLKIGVKVYDLLCGGRNLGRSSGMRRDDVLKIIPGIASSNLLGATRHFDALTQDARLVIDTLRSAATAGAIVSNYARYVEGNQSAAGWDCTVHDEVANQSVSIRARVVINAAGPWASQLPHSSLRLRLTKGVHLIVGHDRLPVNEAVVLTEGKRMLFVIPWGERIILGTTDTEYSGNPADVRTDDADVAYVLNIVNIAFPDAKLTCEDVTSTWAGVRPLIAPKHTAVGAPSDISRTHEIRMAEPGWIDVAGGKLTTYRLMAEQAVDLIGRHLALRLPKSLTAKQPLIPGRFSSVVPPKFEQDVIAECCRNEWAVRLDDVLLRRTAWHYYHSDTARIAATTAAWMADECGWNSAQSAAELARFHEIIGSSRQNPQANSQ
ncbi:MAG TPA: glycerol-3-phosphate dehydrogenase/oxidase [Planctomycetaceae bacterium]|nr:glycerol-3-phosphate dehydrogenase/oxidase [Planctomycetaceae bacterium]HQZ65025.1 glycerol-3-phosphate dehydrogenase/oxidase [Planctomycetaceae bacterium]